MCPSLHSVWTLALWWGYPSAVTRRTSFLPVNLNLKGTVHAFQEACLVQCIPFISLTEHLCLWFLRKLKNIYFKQWKLFRAANYFFAKLHAPPSKLFHIVLKLVYMFWGTFLCIWLYNRYTVGSLNFSLFSQVVEICASYNLQSKTKVKCSVEGMKGLST